MAEIPPERLLDNQLVEMAEAGKLAPALCVSELRSRYVGKAPPLPLSRLAKETLLAWTQSGVLTAEEFTETLLSRDGDGLKPVADEELVAWAKQGWITRSGLFKAFELRHSHRLRKLARKWGCLGYAAYEVAQEVLADFHLQIETFQVLGEGSVRRYLRIAVRWKCLSHHKKRRRRREQQLPEKGEFVDDKPRPGEEAERREGGPVARCLVALPPEDQEILAMRILRGLLLKNIAKAQGCSLAAAYRRYHAALNRLRICVRRALSGDGD